MSGPRVLGFDGVTVRYQPGSVPVLTGVTFALGQAERAALVGLNGSGKTTLLLAAVGLVGHDGLIEVDGLQVGRRTAAEVRRRTGFLFNAPEDQILFPQVIEDVAFGPMRQGEPRDAAYRGAAEMLDRMGVSGLARHPVQHLSHGQKQRVALAGALVNQPPLLLLDEPTSSLDPPGRRALARVLDGFGAAMLVATHDLEFAGRFCRRFLVLDAGRIAYDGPDRLAAERLLGS
ncbi:MAG TPA: ABC transporter ATP-binding protein [Candidatus Aminicenantes bacterium]|nr:ABC transporter ATP-binding protein [Candidatus Aminicenantes bacterium]HRY65172.1 ABC transporter ATP-binding protein [Candidatus Aminicenantes bacterium]HRZ72360.1 ABC transporter ATP-binding protein [Candidatus Aminicenantes bacterium]